MQFTNYFRYFYYIEIYLNPNLVFKLFNLYRLIISILFTYIVISNNLNYIYELLDIYINNYLQELSPTDCILLKMNSLGEPNPFGEGSSNNVPPGNGPSGNNSGIESAIEDEDSKKKRINRLANRRRGLEGPEFSYYDRNTRNYIYPEAYHPSKPEYLLNKTMRIYDHGGIRYTYLCMDPSEDKYSCWIKNPDGTCTVISDKETVMNHINYHRNLINQGNKSEPPFCYETYYREHFEVFKQNKLPSLTEKK